MAPFAHQSKEGLFLLLEKLEVPLMHCHAGRHCLVDQEAVVAEAHLLHFDVALVASLAGLLSRGLDVPLPGLSNSGEILLITLMLLFVRSLGFGSALVLVMLLSARGLGRLFNLVN